MAIPFEAQEPVADRSPPPRGDAVDGWQAFLRGGWLVTSHSPGPAARALVAWSIDGLPKGELLTAEELRVARIRAEGCPVKAVAAETARSVSRTAESLKSAMRKLMIANEAELVGFFGAWPDAMWASSTPMSEGRRLVLRYMPPAWSLPKSLSSAERTIVRALLSGHSQAAIAHAIGVAPRTVANQIASVYRKVDVHSRMDLFVALSRIDAS